jgi:hypothetical protein
MRRRLLAVLASVAVCLGTALVALPPAQAQDVDWPTCGPGVPTNCIESATAGGSPANLASTGTPGDYVYAKASDDPHAVLFGVWHDANGDGSNLTQDADPSVLYQLTVRTTIRPREMSGHLRDANFSTHYDPTTGWEFTVQFRPTEVHHVGYNGDMRSCAIGACGDDTWKASLNTSGSANGYVTDNLNTGLTTRERDERIGMFSAYNAQDHNVFYDPDTNSLVVQLASPHLTGSGALATGSYSTFLPTAFLEGTMNVPDASTLSAGTVTVVRTAGGVSSSAPFTLTHVAGGVRISITGITYSSPTYRIHPGPGKPRYVHARKISAHKARVKFTRPASNGGYRINRYQARCHKLGKAWHSAKGTASPITVGHLPKGKVYCQVRAHNKLGWGAWSAAKHT